MGRKITPNEIRITRQFNAKLEKNRQERGATIIKANERAGYDNFHPLMTRKIIPDSITRLAQLLQLPKNKKLHDEVIKGANFEECLGILGARFDIVLDGEYEPGALCEILCKAIEGDVSWKQETTPIELIEREGTVTIEPQNIPYAEAKNPQTEKEQTIRDNSLFMIEKDCMVCNQIGLCKAAGKCLGNSTEVHESAVESAKKKVIQ